MQGRNGWVDFNAVKMRLWLEGSKVEFEREKAYECAVGWGELHSQRRCVVLRRHHSKAHGTVVTIERHVPILQKIHTYYIACTIKFTTTCCFH